MTKTAGRFSEILSWAVMASGLPMLLFGAIGWLGYLGPYVALGCFAVLIIAWPALLTLSYDQPVKPIWLASWGFLGATTIGAFVLSAMLTFEVVLNTHLCCSFLMVPGLGVIGAYVVAHRLLDRRCDAVLLWLGVMNGAIALMCIPEWFICRSFQWSRNVAVFTFLISAAQAVPSLIVVTWLHLTSRLGKSPESVLGPCCSQCAYDLTGSVQAGKGSCPECGTAIPESQVERIRSVGLPE